MTVIRQATFGPIPVTGAKTVPTGTATALTTTPTARLPSQGVIVQALSTNTVSVYVGGSGVTTSTGIEIAAGKDVFLPIRDPADIYCIAGSASQELRYLWI